MTLREALQIVVRDESLGDHVYSVRDRAAGDATFKGNTWDHPRVTRFSEAVTTLERHLADLDRSES